MTGGYHPDPEADHLDLLLRRFEPEFLGLRMRLQVDHLVRIFGHGLGGFHFENLKGSKSSEQVLQLIGQFGVGFCSSFMGADMSPW